MSNFEYIVTETTYRLQMIAIIDGHRLELKSVDVMKKKLLTATMFTFETHEDTLHLTKKNK